MKKTINYEKDIIFGTKIGEICSISLEHDFTVDDGYLRGEFIVSGEYKANSLSVNKETFNYNLPLEYELDLRCDLSTLTYDVENFEYTTNDDVLSVYIDFGVRYDELPVKPILPSEDIIEEIKADNEVIEERKVPKEEEKEDEEERLDKGEEKVILDSIDDDEEYVKYYVHIVRDGDTLESISAKYNVSIDCIKEYNDVDFLELKSKIIIPSEDE